jgi:guanine deaminase
MLIKTNVLNPISVDKTELMENCFLEIENDTIKSILQNSTSDDYLDYSDQICTPGFIDLHVHLSQFMVRGNSNPQLLDWLNNYVFPEEIKSFNPEYAKLVASEFFSELKAMGTTTAVAYVSASKIATDIAFQEADKAGVRVWLGNIQMDCNAPDELCQSTKVNLDNSFDLCEKWNKKTRLLNYIFTPRFAPVCSRELMKETGIYAQKNDIMIQTHLSENHNEIKWVAKLFPECNSYSDVYLKYGLLGKNTIMAHCIHLSEDEKKIMQETDTRIAHCPESNLFLKSGIFPLNEVEESGLKFGLGSDVAAGTSLSMPYHMRIMDYMQVGRYIPAEKSFYYATLGAAKVLNQDHMIGSIATGKQADLAFWKIESDKQDSLKILQTMQYLPNKVQLKRLFISGKKV